MREAIAIAVVVGVGAVLWIVLRPHRVLLDTLDDCLGAYLVAWPDGVWERKRLRRARTRLFAWSEVARIDAWSEAGVPLGPVCYLEFTLRGGGKQLVCIDLVRWKRFRERLCQRFAGLRESWDETFPDRAVASPATIWAQKD